MVKIVFTVPKGDADFDELAEGEKMTFSGTLRKEGQDKACLVSVNGATIPEYSDSDDEGEEEETEEEVYEEEPTGGFDEVIDKTLKK